MTQIKGIYPSIPVEPGKLEDDIDNSGKYDFIRSVKGLGKTKKEALERMLDNARRVGTDIIYEFRYQSRPDKDWPEICEGKAYRRNLPEPRPAA